MAPTTPKHSIEDNTPPRAPKKVRPDMSVAASLGIKRRIEPEVVNEVECWCNALARVNTCGKKGHNFNKTFYVCDLRQYDSETKKSFGGCKFFHWTHLPIVRCLECERIMSISKSGGAYCGFHKKEFKMSPRMAEYIHLDVPELYCECITDDTKNMPTIVANGYPKFPSVTAGCSVQDPDCKFRCAVKFDATTMDIDDEHFDINSYEVLFSTDGKATVPK